MHVRPPTTSAPAALRILVLGCLAAIALAALAEEGAYAGKPKERYIFVLSRVDLPKGAPAELEGLLRKQMAAAIAKEPLLESAIPADAPAYDEKAKGRYSNKPFHRYMKNRRLRGFKVTIQVTGYEPSLVPNDKKPGQILGRSIMLRMFGETIPDRVMAFSGDGSAAILAEVGKTVRKRDEEWADSDAANLAIEEAVAMSLKKLQTKPAKSKKRRKRKK